MLTFDFFPNDYVEKKAMIPCPICAERSIFYSYGAIILKKTELLKVIPLINPKICYIFTF